MPVDHIVEHTSNPSNANNVEDNNDLTPPLERGTTADGGDDDEDDSSSSSGDYNSGSSVHSQRCIRKTKKVKKIKKQTDHGKRLEQQ